MKSKKLNIAIILPTIISKNGTAKQSLELAKALSKRGHSVSFFTYAYLKDSSFPEFEKFNIYFCTNIKKSIIYRFIKNISTLEKIYLYLGLISISNFRNIFRNKKIEILNPHDWFGIWVSGGLRFQNVPIIANINDVPDRLHGNFWEKFKLKMDRKFSKKVSKIIVLDNNNKDKAKKWLNINDSKITVIRSGINIGKFKNFKSKLNLRKQLGINSNSILFVCANLLAPNRRYEDALYALKKLKNKSIHLIVLSKLDFDKKYGEFLKNIVSKEKLSSHVHFIDKFFSDTERMMYIKNSDILIFPNSPQTWGLTVLEAMALGIPCVVSSGAGVSEILHNKKDALIYRERSVDELIDKLSVLIKNDRLYNKISENGKSYVLKTFSWENYTKDIENVMLKAISG